MINFFRKIRQNLLSEGKNGKPAWPAGRYLKYAIGEIVLVVIGILIALQINNWNTHRIERSKEDRYLVNLKRDLNNQIEMIERNLSGEEFIYNSLTKVKSNFEKHKKFRAVQEDIVLISSMNDRYTFTITSPSYTELLSTGNLDLITDKTFKTQMIKYYEDLELTSKVIQNNNDHKDNVVNPMTLSILEIIGGSEPESIYKGLTSTFDNYETPVEVMAIIKTNIAKPENQLILLNMIRFRRMVAYTHISRLKLAKTQTEKLLNLLPIAYK
jgi:hypothetical protein